MKREAERKQSGQVGTQTGEEVTEEQLKPRKTLDFVSELIYRESEDSEENKSLAPYLIVTRYFHKYEYILEGRVSGELNISNVKTIYPLQYVKEYNSKNKQLEKELDMTMTPVETVTYGAEYETYLHGSTPKSTSKVIYEIPLKLLIDRYLPKTTLLSAWYILKSDVEVNGQKLDIKEAIVEPIKDIYNKACYEGKVVDNKGNISEAKETGSGASLTNKVSFIDFERFEIQANRFGLMNPRHAEGLSTTDMVEDLNKMLKVNISYPNRPDIKVSSAGGYRTILTTGGYDSYDSYNIPVELEPEGNPVMLLAAEKVPGTENDYKVPVISESTVYEESLNGYFDVDNLSDGEIARLIQEIKSNVANNPGAYEKTYVYELYEKIGTDPETGAPIYRWVQHSQEVMPEIEVEEVYMYTVREKSLQYMVDVHSRTMPIYLVKNAVTWSKEATYTNRVLQNSFDPTDWRFIVPRNLYARGLSKLDIGSKENFRVEMYQEPFKYIRENDVITMFSEWEKTAAEGDMASYTYIRETYKLINYILEKDSSHEYIPENSYKYLYVPDTIMDYNDVLTEKVFWMERMGVTEGVDALTKEEQSVYRNRKTLITWQNAEYGKYEECQGDDGKVKVYALFPLGEPMVRAVYEADANGSESVAAKWGAYNPPRHAGVDLYGRRRLINDVVEGSDVYDYELDRLTQILGNAEDAQMKLTQTLEKRSVECPIVAVAPGIVVAAEYTANSGFRVKIQHDKNYVSDGVGAYREGTCTWYMHLRRWPLVKVGDYVGAGTVIGYEGTTGGSGANHLHFEVRIDGNETPKLPTTPNSYIYPMFNPFYNEEKASEEGHSLSSEYMSLQRTITMGATSNNVPSVPLLDDAESQLVTLDDQAEYEIPPADGYVSGTPSYSNDVEALGEYFDESFIRRVINGKSTIKNAL